MHKSPTIIHTMETPQNTHTISAPILFVIVGVCSLLGILVGFSASRIVPNLSSNKNHNTSIKVQTENSAGIVDKKTFKDEAEGILKEGGIDGEGNFHLERPGGKSQNVYLTSSTVDLSLFLNKKIHVYGETFNAQKAGWLMDVGLVEVVK